MPTPENGKSIEKMYWDHVRAMSPAERVHKALSLSGCVRVTIEFQIREKYPEIDRHTLKFAIAHRCYWNEPKVLKMLVEAEKVEKERAND
jgi:hypothetical protein